MAATARRLQNLFLSCGILASLLYVGTDTLAGMLYAGYNFTDQAISELLAIDSPTSGLVVPLFTLYDLLLVAFALGVWLSAGRNRVLRIMAGLIVGNAAIGLMLWNIFPMHMRGVEATFTDTMHIILAGVGVIFILLAVVFGSFAFGKRFRFYSIGTILMFCAPSVLVFLLLSLSFPQFPGETVVIPPMTGVSERISTYVALLWQVVLAIILLRTEKGPSGKH